ncbi:xanthine dehydrogenase family protein subunit M [Pseudoroseomonas cervicalis]|uniref:FAD binding domain-containing protein n=1 Tax=Teichococcus cervicalis TaxID=204525 RepID=UPI00278408F3|nr:xanthine dehydrogenase family protein subunit M [Pseudoroseomonas cervicalis]MDQ1081627.1 xanthine dehydrogenase YagS FAD-binding subunit [Pseudoroseomonas cervicalis]
MRPFDYARAGAVEAVPAALAGGARILAGGTTIYDLMKLGIETPDALLDISGMPGLDGIEIGENEITFGALARMSDASHHPEILRRCPVLAEALAKAASQQLRNMASLGGNLLQRTRCPYFRNGAHYACNKRNPGSGCAAREGLDRGHALFGGSEACIAVYPGDWAVALVALDATLDLLGPEGPRSLAVAELHRLPGDTPQQEHTLRPGEMILRIRVPLGPHGAASTYHKIRDRESYAFALVSAAVALALEGGVVRQARIALGGVATRPWRVPQAEAVLAGRRLDRALALEAGRAAFAEARPGRHNQFKLALGAETVADALMIAAARSPAR